MRVTLRKALAIGIVLLTLVPEVLLVPVLGYVNLAFLTVLWCSAFVVSQAIEKTSALLYAALLGAAMSVPPVPYYVSVVNGAAHFQFLGLTHLLAAGGDFALRFVLYATAFACVIALIGRKPKSEQ